MRIVMLLVGYMILYSTFKVEPFDTQWILSTLAMSLAFWSGAKHLKR